MKRAPALVYVHIGLHKTGTTYLQNVLRANREGLRERLVEFPSGPGAPSQSFAVLDLLGRGPRRVADRRIEGAWDALVAAVNSCGFPTAVISEERLSLGTPGDIRRCVRAFPDSEVHLVVTARDLGRVVVSQWQETVKNDQTWAWREYFDAVKDPSQADERPASQFWDRQDLPAICARWDKEVPPERLHLVTVPPSGSPPDLLLTRFGSVFGVEADELGERPAWTNETVGAAASEILRRLNERLGRRLNQRQYDKVVKTTLTRLLAEHTPRDKVSVPAHEREWVTSRAAEMVAAVRLRGYRVVGDLEELTPRFPEGAREPDDAPQDELVETSLVALSLLCEQYSRLNVEPDTSTPAQGSETGAVSARGV